MKYCVSGRQPKSVLEKADQIKLAYKDRERLIDYIDELSDKTFILEIPKGLSMEEIDWELYEAYSEKVDFIFCIYDLNMAQNCADHNIKFYWAYPVFTWFELRGLVPYNPCYISVSAPISFSLNRIKRYTDIPLRICPNLAYDAYIHRENGLHGSWVRPEDIETYDKHIDVCDFITTDLSKEATLLHIYKENKTWPGNLNLLLTNFDINVDNRAIPITLGALRMNCGQLCMEMDNCNACDRAIEFATEVRKEHYKMNKLTAIEEN